MPIDLSSVNAKLRRANSHFEMLRDELIRWRDGNPYSGTVESNTDSTRYSFHIHIKGTPDFEWWSLIVGDCVHNLRAALEHLVYAIAIHESGQNPPPKEDRLAFPIADDPGDFKEVSRRIATLSDTVQTAIERIQPYNRTHPTLPPPLAILRDFEKTDKHKLLSLAFARQSKASFTVNSKVPYEFSGSFGEIQDGKELMALTFEQPQPEIKFNGVNFEVAVCLWHKQRDPGTSHNSSEAVGLLTVIVDEVRFVIGKVTAAVKT